LQVFDQYVADFTVCTGKYFRHETWRHSCRPIFHGSHSRNYVFAQARPVLYLKNGLPHNPKILS